MNEHVADPFRSILNNIFNATSLVSDGKGGYLYRSKWHIHYEPPPIPVRCCDWQFYHDDYDGAPDGSDHRCGYAGSLAECMTEIDMIEDDE